MGLPSSRPPSPGACPDRGQPCRCACSTTDRGPGASAGRCSWRWWLRWPSRCWPRRPSPTEHPDPVRRRRGPCARRGPGGRCRARGCRCLSGLRAAPAGRDRRPNRGPGRAVERRPCRGRRGPYDGRARPARRRHGARGVGGGPGRHRPSRGRQAYQVGADLSGGLGEWAAIVDSAFGPGGIAGLADRTTAVTQVTADRRRDLDAARDLALVALQQEAAAQRAAADLVAREQAVAAAAAALKAEQESQKGEVARLVAIRDAASATLSTAQARPAASRAPAPPRSPVPRRRPARLRRRAPRPSAGRVNGSRRQAARCRATTARAGRQPD